MTKREIVELLKHGKLEDLRRDADIIRRRFCGDDVFIRGIVEFSNNCCRDCLYCGLRRSNRKLSRFRMTVAGIIGAASKIASAGIGTVVLQSGDDFHYTRSRICSIIRGIRDKCPGMAITLSIGERPFDDYIAFREAGADRYLLKHETANASLYERLHPGQSFKQRVKTLSFLRKLGFQAGSGSMVGLPGQTISAMADDIAFLGDFMPDMAGIGPFIPQEDTPLGGNPSGGLETVLKVICLARIVTGKTLMPATTALATLSPDEGHVLGFRCGCNVAMINFTPSRHRLNYRIYDNKAMVDINAVEEAVHASGRRINTGRGDSMFGKIL